MSASAKCHHPARKYAVSAVQVPGEAELFLHLSSHCEACGARFRFVGLEPAHDPRMPGVNRDATEVVLPMIEVA